MTSCLKEYVEISERSEVSSNDFAAAFPKDYEVGKSYKIRSTTTMELDLEKNNDYMIRLFPAEDFEGVELQMFDEKGTRLVTNFLAEKYYRGFTFKNTTTAKYRLEITVPDGKKNVSMAMASRKFEEESIVKDDEQGFKKIKTYNITKNKDEYTLVLSAGTMFRFDIQSEEEINVKIVSEEGKEYFNYTPRLDLEYKSMWMMGDHDTGIYYLKIDKKGTKPATIDLKFKRRKQQEEENEKKKDN
jgi:hypothetical protein